MLSDETRRYAQRASRDTGEIVTSGSLPDGVAVADVVDVMTSRFKHRAHILDLVSPKPGRVLFGRAVTMSFFPYREDLMDDRLHTLGPVFYDAIRSHDPAGKVLVMASNGHPDISLGGGTKLSRLRNHGMAGVIADGRLRDLSELAGYGLAVWCTGETTKAGGAVIRPYLANVPVSLGGVTVVPGDYVVADSSGAVVIPPSHLDDVLEAAGDMAAMARQMEKTIRSEDPEEIRHGSDELLL